MMLNFQRLFESIPGLYIIYDLDFVIVGGSDDYFQATLTKREEVVGRHLFEVFPDNSDDPKADGVRNLRASLNSMLKYRKPHTVAVQKYDIRRPESEGGGLEERYWTPVNSPAYAGEVDQQAAIAAEFRAHLSKPVEPDAIITAVARLCRPQEER